MEHKAAETLDEILDFTRSGLLRVINLGGEKYGHESWKDPLNARMTPRANYDSMLRHLVAHGCDVETDWESGVDPLYHLIVRALYVLSRRGCVKTFDTSGEISFTDGLRTIDTNSN